MHKKLEINRTKIKGSCQSGIKVVPHDSKSDLPLVQWYHSLVYVAASSGLLWFYALAPNNSSVPEEHYSMEKSM